MGSIRVLIVEDEVIVSEEIKEVLTREGYQVTGQCTSADEAMEVLRDTPSDIALLDINLDGDRDGIELAKEIVKSHRCAVIFLTAFANEAFLQRAKEVRPAAYIVKPYEQTNLLVAIEIAFNNLLEAGVSPHQELYRVTDFIFIRDHSRFKRVPIEEIAFAQANGSYTTIVTDSGTNTLAVNLKQFEGSLEAAQFMRIHRSYVINLDKVDEYEGNRVFINSQAIPLSSSYKEDFLRRYTFL